MNRNKLLLISIAGASLLAIAGSQMVWSKGHVPSHMVQFCHLNEVVQVAAPAAVGHFRHGDIQLPTDDGLHVFFSGGFCDVVDTNNDGMADFD